MKLTVQRLGRIENAELDIKPFTVFFGPNGTNKTWTIWALDAVLKMFAAGPPSNASLLPPQQTTSEGYAHFMEQLGPIADVLRKNEKPNFIRMELAPHDPDQERTFNADTSGDVFAALARIDPSRANVGRVSLAGDERDTLTRLESLTLDLRLSTRVLRIESHWRTPAGPTTTVNVLVDDWTVEKLASALAALVLRVYPAVVSFPAERGGLLVMEPFAPQPLDRGPPMALTDFVELIRYLALTAPERGPLADLVETKLRSITGGSVDLVEKEAGKLLLFRTGETELPITVASSFVRTVAGLALYLRHLARPGDVVLIDELELNAHPQAQLALVELMATMVNAGIRVIFTTHSPYVLDHINNLMEASRVPAERRDDAAKLFALKSASAFLPTEKVAAWRFVEEEGTNKVLVQDAIDDSYKIIVGSTFGPASETALNTYGELLDMQPAKTKSTEGAP